MHRMPASALWPCSVASLEERRFLPPARLNARSSYVGLSRVSLQMVHERVVSAVYFKANGCLDSTPQNLLTGNLHPGWPCRCSMWARAPVLDSFNACTGPRQYLQRIISPRSVRASYRVHGSQRPRTLTSHSVITGGFFLVAISGYDAPGWYRAYPLSICIAAARTAFVKSKRWYG